MLELAAEVFLHTLPNWTGHALVYAVTLGRVRASDGVADVVGAAFWVAVVVAVAVVLAR